MVERYNGIEKDPDGAFVYYQDYEALEAKLAALVEATSHAYSEWDGGSHEEAIVAMRQLKAAIAAAKVTP